MLVTSPRDILRAFSEGHIGWREAARRLDVEEFSEIEAMMKAYGLPLYELPPKEANARMKALHSTLYGKKGGDDGA